MEMIVSLFKMIFVLWAIVCSLAAVYAFIFEPLFRKLEIAGFAIIQICFVTLFFHFYGAGYGYKEEIYANFIMCFLESMFFSNIIAAILKAFMIPLCIGCIVCMIIARMFLAN